MSASKKNLNVAHCSKKKILQILGLIFLNINGPLTYFLSSCLCKFQVKHDQKYSDEEVVLHTLQMVSSVSSADSPGRITVRMGRPSGKHTQEGVRRSFTIPVTHICSSFCGRKNVQAEKLLHT